MAACGKYNAMQLVAKMKMIYGAVAVALCPTVCWQDEEAEAEAEEEGERDERGGGTGEAGPI